MNIRLKFNIVLISTFLLGLAATGVYYEHFVRQIMVESVTNESKMHMQAALAIRIYTSREVAPLINHLKTHVFLPQSLPAVAARETMAIFYQQNPKYRYRETALNPSNPKDRAQGWEKDIINQYRENKIHDEHIEFINRDGHTYVNIARPIKITDSSCLVCHGDPSTAPDSVTKKYGTKNGFGWKKNEIIGAQIVSIPLNLALERAKAVYNKFILSLVGIFSLLLLVSNILLGRIIIIPLQKDNLQLSVLASHDPLTGALNRRAFEETFAKEAESSKNNHSKLSLIVFDIDHFKHVNDQFGHEKGDIVLKTICQHINLNIKKQDSLIRLGGEEFAILLPHTSLEGAYQLAESLCVTIAKEETAGIGIVTASFGVATWQEKENLASFMKRADNALYEAKCTGRNRVIQA